MRRLLVAISIFGLSLFGCEDALEVTPENSVTYENAFQTEKDIVAALNATEAMVRRDLKPLDYQLYSGIAVALLL